MNLTLIYPMFAMVFLTVLVLLWMFRARVRAVKNGDVSFRYFKTYDVGTQPEYAAKASRHFTNLFEVPVLFYAGVTLALVIPITGFWIQFWAWLFVAARCIHAIIHLGPNKLLPRMSAYGIGWISVLAIWISLLIHI